VARRRYGVLPGMTGLWQIAAAPTHLDDLVRSTSTTSRTGRLVDITISSDARRGLHAEGAY